VERKKLTIALSSTKKELSGGMTNESRKKSSTLETRYCSLILGYDSLDMRNYGVSGMGHLK
jgi:hypothetical protein